MSYLQQASKPKPTAPIITIVGFAGAGKSSLGALFPNPIFIQAESCGTVFEKWDDDNMPMLLPEVPYASKKRNISTKNIIIEQINELTKEDHDYKTLVFDTITTMSMKFEEEIVEFDEFGANNIGEANGSFGKGYLYLASMHMDVVKHCKRLRNHKNMAIVFLSHTGIEKVKNRPDSQEYTAYTLDMHEKSRGIYVNNSDCVLYLKSDEIVKGAKEDKKGRVIKTGQVVSTGERFLITSTDGTVGYINAKNRYEMPVEMEVPSKTNPILEYIPHFNKGL